MGELVSLRGVYPADRAAALSGVPKSTIYYWANNKILVPSMSPTKERLWSYSDLLGLRAVYWLRQEKPDAARTTMRAVRETLADAASLGISFEKLELCVDRGGAILYRHPEDGQLRRPGGQVVLEEPLRQLNLIIEYRAAGRLGPNLKRPREHLLILPGKLSGEPHIEGTRIATANLAALVEGGMSHDVIRSLYPSLADRPSSIDEAVSLEKQLAENLRQGGKPPSKCGAEGAPGRRFALSGKF